MIDREILLAFSEAVQEDLKELEQITETEEALRYIRSISRSAKLVDLETMHVMGVELSKSIQLSDQINNLDVKRFIAEANSLIHAALKNSSDLA